MSPLRGRQECANCKGLGYIVVWKQFQDLNNVNCPWCEGRGYFDHDAEKRSREIEEAVDQAWEKNR